MSGSSSSGRRPRRSPPRRPSSARDPTSVTSSSRKNGLPPLRSSEHLDASTAAAGCRCSALEQLLGGLAVQRVEVEDEVVVPARRGRPSLGRSAGGRWRCTTSGRAVEALEQVVDQREHAVVGPVEVGELQQRAGATRVAALDVRDAASAIASSRALAGRQLARRLAVAHEVQEPVRWCGRPRGRRRAGRTASATRSAVAACATASGSPAIDAAPVAQRLGDRPPDVGLAVGHAATVEHDRTVVARPPDSATSSARRVLPTPASPTQQREQARAGGVNEVSSAWCSRNSSCSRPMTGTSTRRGRRPGGSLALERLPGLDRLVLALRADRPAGLVADDQRRWRLGRGARRAPRPARPRSAAGWRC